MHEFSSNPIGKEPQIWKKKNSFKNVICQLKEVELDNVIIIGTRTELCIYIQVTKDIILIGRLLKNEQQPTSSIGTCDSVRADNRYDWISADISIIGLLSVLLISTIPIGISG